MAYVSQEMLTNVTTLTIMNEDLHVFIPQDLNPLGQSESTPSFEKRVLITYLGIF